jgi:hypothetical protein
MNVVSGIVQLRWTVDTANLKESYGKTQENFAKAEQSGLSPTLEDHLKEIIVCATPGDWVDLFINGEDQDPVRVYFENDDNDVEIEEGLDDVDS